ncbi:endo-1,6-alpha-mannosidase [Heliocybe sulcata]|uniref:Endo-1,6-alpha-mannosidase n=1 Tax=Heliocybe sulcata TaxID=5364 RepID=A0A5C3N639_9AGAM|nr:endo-1,6-alpha-mannosidase [Heliocybe sulcata]
MQRRSILFLGLCGLALAQDLSVPSGWREPTNSRSYSDRVSIAQNAINEMTGQLNSATAQFNGLGWWQSGNVWSVMANQDHFTQTTTNQAAVVNGLNTGWSEFANYDQYQWWATAAYYGYRAYGDSNLLQHAIDTWNHVSGYQVTAAQASGGSTPVKGFSIEGTCNGATMAGGVFWRPTSDDQGINSITTGLFMTLGAYLAEATGNTNYRDAATAAATWIRAHNLNADDIVLDTVNAHDCSTSPSNWLFTYNSGKYVEGLSVLADVTGDDTWRTLMVDVVAAAAHTTAWQGSNGVITEGVSTDSDNGSVGFKAVLVRGLHEVYTRSESNTDLRTLVKSYIDVQYNALLELAANGNTYSSSWAGPSQSFTSWGQLAALDPLTAAIDANN